MDGCEAGAVVRSRCGRCGRRRWHIGHNGGGLDDDDRSGRGSWRGLIRDNSDRLNGLNGLNRLECGDHGWLNRLNRSH